MSELYLYTFIMKYEGGVYISQVSSINEYEAMRLWLKSLDVNLIEHFSIKNKERLINEDFIYERPIEITGCKNVWDFGLRIKKSKNLALINMIKTSR